MDVRFWGVRGSIASWGSHVARIGGNTPCLEVTSQGERLILDAGTGIRALGETLLKSQPIKATMLFSHLHWDHVQGFPFFTPAYLPTSSFVMYGPGQGGGLALKETLSKQMEGPTFPVPLTTMRAQFEYRSAISGQTIEQGPFRITPLELPHPQGCNGYLIEADGQRLAYCTDVEISPSTITPTLVKQLEGVDALVLDAQYTPEEYEGRGTMPKKGWGHSTMMDAAGIAKLTEARRLFLFHHDPSHSDDFVESMSEAARRVFPMAEPAREGKTFSL